MTTITSFGVLAILALCHAAPTKLKRLSPHDQEQPIMVVCNEEIPLDLKRSSTFGPSQLTTPQSSNPATMEDDIQRAYEHRTPLEDSFDHERALNSRNHLHHFTKKHEANDLQRALVDDVPFKAECQLVPAKPIATGPSGEGPGSRTYPKAKIPRRKPAWEEEDQKVVIRRWNGTNGPQRRPIAAKVTIFSKSQKRRDHLRKAHNILQKYSSWNSAFHRSVVKVVRIGSFTNGFRRYKVLFTVRFKEQFRDEVIM